MTKVDAFISVVAPLRNDGDIIASFAAELIRVLEANYSHYEVVFVDEGSTDDTVARITELLARHDFLRLIRLSQRFSLEVAILAGMECVIGDWIVVLSADTDPPERIPEMIELGRGGAQIVSGVRRIREDEPFRIRLLAPLFYWYCNRVLKLGIPRNTTEFRVLSRGVVDAILRTKDLLRFMRMYSAYVGFPSATLTYDMMSRRGSVQKRSFGEAMRRSLGIIVANSTHPLRLISLFGLIASVLSGAWAVYLLFTGAVATGMLSLQTSILFFFLFLTQATLCEYVRRIVEENSSIPSYYILEERTSSVLVDEESRKNVVGPR